MSPDPVTNTSLGEIAGRLHGAQSIVVLSHLRPDGDAIGSQLALTLALRGLGKDVRAFNEDGVPESLSFLPGAALVETPATITDAKAAADIVVACDTASRKRLGEGVLSVVAGKTWINVDHHISNECYGDLHYVDPVAPATGQVIHQLLQAGQIPVTREMGENLFVAIATDTGSFQYPNTTAETFRIGADLIDCGVDVGKLSQAVYGSYPLRRVLLLRELLQQLEIGHSGQRASWAMSLELAERLQIQAADTDGLIDHIRSIDGVLVAAFFQEAPDGCVRASLRSKDARVDVCAICRKFNGGGHRLAAGVRLRATLPEAQNLLLTAIDEALEGIH